MTVGLWAWLLLAAAALIVGISKTSIAGLAALAVAAFATVLPAKDSTAAVLILLISGDIVAVIIYHRASDWALLRRLLPAVVPGIVLGAVFMRFVSNQVLLLTVAASLFVAVGLQIGLRVRQRPPQTASPVVPETRTGGPDPAVAAGPAGGPVPPGNTVGRRPRVSLVPALAAGIAAGFTTMVANAAGAVMSLYLLAIKADKIRFVATGAWFFFLINLAKTPFTAALGLFHPSTLLLLATLVPIVWAGTWIGRRVFTRLGQNTFEWMTIAASALSALVLLLKGLF